MANKKTKTLANPDSPFNWQGKPSIFSKSHDYNGVNAERSRKASQIEKQDIYLLGGNPYIRVKEKELTAYSKAVIKTTKEALNL